MVITPAIFPVITPDVLILPFDELLLDQVPPGVASITRAVWLVHTVLAPEIGDGNGFTVTIPVTKQPKPVV